MSKVVNFTGVSDPAQPRDAQPDAELVQVLAELLDDARAGEIRGIAIALVRRGDVLGVRFRHDGLNGNNLAAAVGQLFHDYMAARRGDAEDDGCGPSHG